MSENLFTAVLLFGVFFGGAQPVWPESLKETIDLALAHDATIKSAQAGVQAAQLDALAAARRILPSLSLGAGYQYTSSRSDMSLEIPSLPKQTISLAPQNTFDMSAGVKWTPFTGFAQEASVDLGRLGVTLAENTLDSTETQVALKTITAFRQAQAALLLIDTVTSGRQRVQLQLDQTTALEKEGMAQKVDILSLTIAKLGYDQKLIAAKAGLADALELLKSLTGKEIGVPPVPKESPRITLPPLKEEALDRIKALAIQRSILRANKKLAESKLYPTLALNGTLHYGIPGVNPVRNEWMLYGIAGASLSWSFNWGGDSLAVRAVEHNLAKLSSDETSAREQIELEYNGAVRDWAAMKDELEVLEASLDLASAKMAIVKSQYEQGLASTTDFNDANLELTQAELQCRTQLLSLLLKANQIEALSGEPIDQWSVTQ